MCGLVGVAGDVSNQMQSQVFRDFLDVCQLRGRDSTGVIKVDRKLDYDWVKRVGAPAFLRETRDYDRVVEKGWVSALIGHCRSKTVGDVSLKNAHPFDFPEAGICGVHNGTLRGHHNLDTHEYGKVDSEVLYGHMAKNGVDDTFKKVEGAYACVWWDNNSKTLNFIRNSERPLWFTWSADMKMMFWASEPWMFGAVSRKIKLWEGGEDKKPFHELPPHTLWSFNLKPEAKGEEKTVTMLPPREIKPEPKVVVRQGGYHGSHHGNGYRGWSGFDGDEWDNDGWERQDNGVWTKKKEEPKETSVKGGEVTNPFLLTGPKEPILDSSKLTTEEKDGSANTGSPNSNLSNVTYLKHSATSLGSSTALTPSKRSARKTLSLNGKDSRSCPTEHSEGCCGASEKSSGNSLIQTLHGVSLRTVAGIKYLTDNATETEWSADTFYDLTGGKCCFCKEYIKELEEVAEVLSDNAFMCVSCLQEPKVVRLSA